MKFLIDVGVGKLVEDFLREENHDVKSIRNLNPTMEDYEILQLAVKEARLIITMDKDFGELVFNSKLEHHGVLLLRVEDMNGEEKKEIVKYILENHANEIDNNFCVFQKGKIRIRRK